VVAASFEETAGAKLARAVISGARNRLKPVSNNMNKVHGYKTLFDGKKTKGTGGIMIILGILGIFFPQLKEYVAADPDAAVDAISALFAAFGGMVIWFRGWKDRQLIDQAKLTGQPVVFRASPVELEGWVEADPTDNLGD